MKKLEHLENGILNFELITELRKPIFTKTKIDVVYSDLNNWDNEKLLYYSSDLKKGAQRKLSYIEYIWVKIIEELKKYNFSNDEIIIYRNELFTPYKFSEEIIQLLIEKSKSLLKNEEINKVSIQQFKEVLNESIFTEIELVIIDNIIHNSEANILFFKNPCKTICLSQNAQIEIEKNGFYENLKTNLKQTHLNISLHPIISQFVENNTLNKQKNMTISDDEYQILTEIRKRLKDVKSIEIFYKKEGKLDRIDITTLKAVKAESELMEIFKKSEYATIEMKTQKGNIVCINHTEKIKF